MSNPDHDDEDTLTAEVLANDINAFLEVQEDPEIDAIRFTSAAFARIDQQARVRVLRYLADRFDTPLPAGKSGMVFRG